MRWHNKPPVNGRELTAEDVKYTYERFLTIKGNPNRPVLEMVDKVEAVDKYTVKFTLSEPNAWFLDALASTSTWIIARECVEKFGDLKKPEAVIGTGPWMLERYEPNVAHHLRPAPQLLRARACPTRTAWRSPSTADPAAALRRLPGRQVRLRPGVPAGRPPQRSATSPGSRINAASADRGLHRGSGGITAMKLDQEPFKDVRVRRAFAMADNWREVLETQRVVAWARARPTRRSRPRSRNGPSRSTSSARRAASSTSSTSPGAKKLLAEAGYPERLQGAVRDDGRLRPGLRWTPCRSRSRTGRPPGSTPTSSSRSTAPSSPARSSASSTR